MNTRVVTNWGKIKTWGADRCRLAAPKGCSKVPRPSKLQTREDPCHQRNEEICTFAHSAYKARLDEEKEEKKKELEETKKKKEEYKRLKKEKKKEKLLKSRGSLAKNEADILKNEKKAREDLEAADELLSDATSKLHDALSVTSVNRQSVNVATMMLNNARTRRD